MSKGILGDAREILGGFLVVGVNGHGGFLKILPDSPGILPDSRKRLKILPDSWWILGDSCSHEND